MFDVKYCLKKRFMVWNHLKYFLFKWNKYDDMPFLKSTYSYLNVQNIHNNFTSSKFIRRMVVCQDVMANPPTPKLLAITVEGAIYTFWEGIACRYFWYMLECLPCLTFFSLLNYRERAVMSLMLCTFFNPRAMFLPPMFQFFFWWL